MVQADLDVLRDAARDEAERLAALSDVAAKCSDPAVAQLLLDDQVPSVKRLHIQVFLDEA